MTREWDITFPCHCVTALKNKLYLDIIKEEIKK